MGESALCVAKSALCLVKRAWGGAQGHPKLTRHKAPSARRSRTTKRKADADWEPFVSGNNSLTNADDRLEFDHERMD